MEQPLLGSPADPPIDDDDYNFEAQKFPSGLQVHLIYAVYILSSVVSRVFEATCPLVIALIFDKNYMMVSLYAVTMSAFGPQLEQYGRWLINSTPRYKLMKNTILAHRLLPLAASIGLTYLHEWKLHNWLRVPAIAAVVLALVVGRAATATQLNAIETDWTHIMSNEQSGAYQTILHNLHLVSIAVSAAGPAIAGVLLSNLWIEKTLRVTRFMLGISLLVEFSLIWQLYSTCYALSVPRPYQQQAGPNSLPLMPEMTVRRILQYVWLKPRPVVCSLGIILLKANLLVIGPQFIFYFINSAKMPLWAVSLLPALQIVAYMTPALVSAGLASLINLLALGGVVALVVLNYGNGYLVALCIIVSRSCLQILDTAAQWYIDDLVNDRSVLTIFHRAEVSTLRLVDILSQTFTLIWYATPLFWIPVVFSGSLAVLGLALFTLSRKSNL